MDRRAFLVKNIYLTRRRKDAEKGHSFKNSEGGRWKSEKKRKMGHGFTQIYTDKNIFYALRAGLSVQQRIKVKIFDVP